MKHIALAALVLLPVASFAAADSAARTALLQTDVDWSRVTAPGKDIEKILSYWSDDAIIYPPGQLAVSGKTAIRNYVTQNLKSPFFSVSWKPAQAVVSDSGELGYTMGSNEITVPDSSGKVARVQGRYLTVWRRTGGAWKCVVDFWNESPLPPPPIPRVSAKPSAKPAAPTKTKSSAQPTPRPSVKPTIKPDEN